MGFQSAFGDTGVILGMASGAVLAVAVGWQSPFFLWGGINLAAVALGLYLVRGRRYRPQPSRSSFADYVRVLRDVRLWLLPLALGGAVYNIVSYFGPLLLVTKFSLAKDAAGRGGGPLVPPGAPAPVFFWCGGPPLRAGSAPPCPRPRGRGGRAGRRPPCQSPP